MNRTTGTAKTSGSRELPEGHVGAAYHYQRASYWEVRGLGREFLCLSVCLSVCLSGDEHLR